MCVINCPCAQNVYMLMFNCRLDINFILILFCLGEGMGYVKSYENKSSTAHAKSVRKENDHCINNKVPAYIVI